MSSTDYCAHSNKPSHGQGNAHRRGIQPIPANWKPKIDKLLQKISMKNKINIINNKKDNNHNINRMIIDHHHPVCISHRYSDIYISTECIMWCYIVYIQQNVNLQRSGQEIISTNDDKEEATDEENQDMQSSKSLSIYDGSSISI